MNTNAPPPRPALLLQEVEARLVQALDNFFQRSRPAILDEIIQATAHELSPSVMAATQICREWLDQHPHRLSAAFVERYRDSLAPPAGSAEGPQPDTLQLVDDDLLDRQLTESQAGHRLGEALRPESAPFFARLRSLCDPESADRVTAYGPQPIVRALSSAFDSLGLDTLSGTLLLKHASVTLQDTLRHTYAALNQFLANEGIEAHTPHHASQPQYPAANKPSAGEELLNYIERHAATQAASLETNAPYQAASGNAQPAPSFQHVLDAWQTGGPPFTVDEKDISTLQLRQLQAHALHTDAGHFDLAILDALAAMFEHLLDDTSISASYRSAIAQLQIPTLRIALAHPAFFSDDKHPARRTLDLLGQFSRRYPERYPTHELALAEVESACQMIVHSPSEPLQAFTATEARLSTWMAQDNARAEATMAIEIENLQAIERQERATLLALETLQDLTARYPAPETVLRQLESAWVPHMVSLYLAETGEGPQWRAACQALTQLFISLQAPEDDVTREIHLKNMPAVNGELRKGLLAQGSQPEQLKDFFQAITAAQECWVRPAAGRQMAMTNRFEPRQTSLDEIAVLARHTANTAAPDAVIQQIETLMEGDWIDFHPAWEGLSTARIAWVGLHGYLLLCDASGDTRLSTDSAQLTDAIRSGEASIPEPSVTRRAMLRVRDDLAPHAS